MSPHTKALQTQTKITNTQTRLLPMYHTKPHHQSLRTSHHILPQKTQKAQKRSLQIKIPTQSSPTPMQTRRKPNLTTAHSHTSTKRPRSISTLPPKPNPKQNTTMLPQHLQPHHTNRKVLQRSRQSTLNHSRHRRNSNLNQPRQNHRTTHQLNNRHHNTSTNHRRLQSRLQTRTKTIVTSQLSTNSQSSTQGVRLTILTTTRNRLTMNRQAITTPKAHPTQPT